MPNIDVDGPVVMSAPANLLRARVYHGSVMATAASVGEFAYAKDVSDTDTGSAQFFGSGTVTVPGDGDVFIEVRIVTVQTTLAFDNGRVQFSREKIGIVKDGVYDDDTFDQGSGGGGGIGGLGNGTIPVDENTGGANAMVTQLNGVAAGGVTIKAYAKADWDANPRLYTVQGTTVSTAGGRWLKPLMLDIGLYTITFEYPSYDTQIVQNVNVA